MHINVLEHEPHTALFVPDDDALIFYRSILDYAKTSLLPGGKIYFEINEAMENEIKQLLLQYGYQYAEVIPDINGKPRIAKAIKPV
jgi:release factor glutamine methyltransferase